MDENQTKISQQNLLYSVMHQPSIDFLSGKAKVTISDGHTSEKGNLYVRSKSDSVIWFAIKKLSVEGGRAQLTKDSAVVINRLEKTFQKFALDTISELYGINPSLEFIQTMINGTIPTIDTVAYFEEKTDSTHYKIRSMSSGLLTDISIDLSNNKASKIVFQDKYNNEATWHLSDYRIINDSIVLPFVRKYELSTNETKVTLDLKFSDLVVNEAKSIKFSIPNHYNQIK